MKYQKLIFAEAFCSMAFISCNSSEEATETTMVEDEQIIEDVTTEKSTVPETTEDVIYNKSVYIGQFPLVDQVMKYSSLGIQYQRLTKEMANLAKAIVANFGDKVSVLQYGEV